MSIEFTDSTEIPGLIPFLCEHFPNRNECFWRRSLQQLNHPSVTDLPMQPPKVAVLREQDEIVACMLILQKASTAVSLSSWAVRPDRGSVAYPFLRAVIKRLENFDIYNHSAVPGVDKLMGLVGFEHVRSCGVPLPRAMSFVRAIRSLRVIGVGENIYLATFHSGAELTFKRLSIMRDGRLRRLSLLLTCSDGDGGFEVISDWSAWCILRGLIPILGAPEHGLRVINIGKFGTMCRKGKGAQGAVVPWHDTYVRSEFAMMDF